MQWRIKRAIYSVYEIFEKNLGAVGATGKFLGAAVGWVNCDSGGRGQVDGSPELLRLATQFVLQLGQHGDCLGDDGRPQGSDVQLAGPQ